MSDWDYCFGELRARWTMGPSTCNDTNCHFLPTQRPHTISWQLQQIPTWDGDTVGGCVYPLVCNLWAIHRSRRKQATHQKLPGSIYHIARANTDHTGKFCPGPMPLIPGIITIWQFLCTVRKWFYLHTFSSTTHFKLFKNLYKTGFGDIIFVYAKQKNHPNFISVVK